MVAMYIDYKMTIDFSFLHRITIYNLYYPFRRPKYTLYTSVYLHVQLIDGLIIIIIIRNHLRNVYF